MRILVFDDEWQVVEYLRDLLELSGHVVDGMGDLDQLTARLTEHRPEAFIIDLNQPSRLNAGLEMLEQARACGYGHLPYVVYTKHTSAHPEFRAAIDRGILASRIVNKRGEIESEVAAILRLLQPRR